MKKERVERRGKKCNAAMIVADKAFIIVTGYSDVMRLLSVTGFCDWLAVYLKYPGHHEAFLICSHIASSLQLIRSFGIVIQLLDEMRKDTVMYKKSFYLFSLDQAM